MAFSFLNEVSLQSDYRDAEAQYSVFLDDIDEQERMAANKPKDEDSKRPKTTEGTTASYLSSRPKSVVQKTPTGRVKIEGGQEYEDKVSLLIETDMLPHATTNGTVYQKSIAITKKAMTYGSQPSLSFVREDHDGTMRYDFLLPYIKDVVWEPGKMTDSDANFAYMNAWFKKSDLEAIYNAETERKPSTWDLDKLKELIDSTSNGDAKDADKQNRTEREKDLGAIGYVRLIYAFQVGVGNDFYIFLPDGEGWLRKWQNPDPRGKMPLKCMYFDIDLASPIGVSAIAMSMPMQDMLDKHMQAFQFAVAMGLAPPIKTAGDVNLMSIRMEPGSVWDLNGGSAEVVQTGNGIISNFGNVYGLLKAQILELTNNGDTSISSESGVTGYSKTPAGVRAQEARVDIADNHLTCQFLEWYQKEIETGLNLLIAARNGKGPVSLTDSYIMAQKRVNPDFDLLTEEIDYDELHKLSAKFVVDASSSKLSNDEDQAERLYKLLELRASNPELASVIKLDVLAREYAKRIGIENADEIVPEQSIKNTMTNNEEVALPEQPSQMAPEQPVDNAPLVQEPPAPISNEESMLAQELTNNGQSREAIIQAIAELRGGVSPEVIDKELTHAK